MSRYLLSFQRQGRVWTPEAPTERQIRYLRDARLNVEDGLTRGRAEKSIREHEKARYEAQERLEEAPEIEAFKRKLEELTPRVCTLVPDWAPMHFDDAESYMFYEAIVEEALDYAKLADVKSLQSGFFSDGVSDTDYYLESARDPSPAEFLAFQSGLFKAYLLAESEEFDHLAILKRTLPMIKVSIVSP